MSEENANGAPIPGPDPDGPAWHDQHATPRTPAGVSTITLTVRMTVEVTDPMALAAYLLVGHDHRSGELTIAPAGAPHDDAATVVAEYLHEAFASGSAYTGLTLHAVEPLHRPQPGGTT